MIQIENICKTYFIGTNEVHALNGINLTVNDGELLAIMGASGSGKSTLMHIIGLLDRPSTGNYLLNNKEVSKLTPNQAAYIRNHEIGFIFQQFFLLPRLTAVQNVELPLIYRDVKSAVMRQQAIANLEKVGMAKYADHTPNELSGGQQQRVAIARALIGKPTVILADEPTGALDSKTSQDVMNLLINLNQTEKATVIVVTHDPRVAEQCHRMVRISDGKLVE